MALTDGRVTDLVVDFSRVTFMDSSGLGAIVELHGQAAALGKQLTLRAVPPAVSRIFEVTGLDRQFHIEPGDAGRC